MPLTLGFIGVIGSILSVESTLRLISVVVAYDRCFYRFSLITLNASAQGVASE